jgi:hypothetical protein
LDQVDGHSCDKYFFDDLIKVGFTALNGLPRDSIQWDVVVEKDQAGVIYLLNGNMWYDGRHYTGALGGAYNRLRAQFRAILIKVRADIPRAEGPLPAAAEPEDENSVATTPRRAVIRPCSEQMSAIVRDLFGNCETLFEFRAFVESVPRSMPMEAHRSYQKLPGAAWSWLINVVGDAGEQRKPLPVETFLCVLSDGISDCVKHSWVEVAGLLVVAGKESP